MLVVFAVNDGSGTQVKGNYDVTVRVNNKTIWSGKIKNHNREKGWQNLLHLIAMAGT